MNAAGHTLPARLLRGSLIAWIHIKREPADRVADQLKEEYFDEIANHFTLFQRAAPIEGREVADCKSTARALLDALATLHDSNLHGIDLMPCDRDLPSTADILRCVQELWTSGLKWHRRATYLGSCLVIATCILLLVFFNEHTGFAVLVGGITVRKFGELVVNALVFNDIPKPVWCWKGWEHLWSANVMEVILGRLLWYLLGWVLACTGGAPAFLTWDVPATWFILECLHSFVRALPHVFRGRSTAG